MDKKILLNEQELKLELIKRNDHEVQFKFNGNNYHFQIVNFSLEHNTLILKNEFNEQFKFFGFSNEKEKSIDIFHDGFESTLKLLDGISNKKSKKQEGSLLSPMPGKIIKVFVTVNQDVKKGEPLIILEAMKMEHTIKATKDGTIEKIFFKEGDQVNGQMELIKLKES